MNKEKIQKAREEAKKFVMFCDDAIAARSQEGRDWDSPRETGLVRHQSMILTRALADLRRP